MTKFVRVMVGPSQVDKDCYVIDAPNFRTEIEKSINKKPKNGLMAPNFLREIFAAIGDTYSNNYNALISVNTSGYKGIPINNQEDIERIVMDIVNKQCPFFIDSFIDKQIKNRPNGTKLIYFLGNFNQTGPFTRNGIDEIKFKDIDVYLGNTKKKIVGKPAITNEEVATLNQNN